MNVNQMREELARHYGAASPFARRLKNMQDNQIVAIYFRLKKKGEIK